MTRAHSGSWKQQVIALDDRLLRGRVRRWNSRLFSLGHGWGEFFERIQRHDVPGVRVLDAGAGEAIYRKRFRHARYVALDFGLGEAEWDYSALDVLGDLMAVPLRDGSFDLVMSISVLEHMPDPVGALVELARVLRPGGLLYLATDQCMPQHQKPYDFFRYTSFGLRHILAKADLEPEEIVPMGGVYSHLWAAAGAACLNGSRLRSGPVSWLLRPASRLASRLVYLTLPFTYLLDKLDAERDHTLGYYCLARKVVQAPAGSSPFPTAARGGTG